MAEAKSQAGLKADEKIDLLILPKPKSLLEQMFGGSAVDSRIRQAAPQLIEPLADVETAIKLFSRPAVTIMPYQVKIK